MTALGLGEIEAFPFVDPPDRRSIRDGVALLEELGALDPVRDGARKRLTSLGRNLAQLPVDPRMGRMVLEAEGNGALGEVIVIAAALSIQDPRERPVDKQQAADGKHARFTDKDSDFAACLNLWNYLEQQQTASSSSAFRRLCRSEFLNYLRVREWQDLVAQLRQITKQLGMSVNGTPADAQRIHRSVLAGLLSHIGLRDPEKQDYQGARGARFTVFPGSGLFKKPPRWVMAAELVETSRLWGRVNARIEPEWVEPLAQHLVQRTYSEPRWDRRRAAVLATERVTLYGIPIVAGRTVTYGRIDPVVSREIFVRHALVEGDWDTRHAFFHDNRRLVAELEELEHKARRRDVVVDDEVLFTFFDDMVGADVVSGRHFDSWWKKTRRVQPDLLTFSRDLLLSGRIGGVSEESFPEQWRHGELALPLSYQFEPGSATDGVTVEIPLTLLNQVAEEQFEWQVPGLREDLVTALIRSLPKAIRRSFVPAPNYAKSVLERVTAYDGSLLDALQREFRAMGGPPITRDDWGVGKVPPHLRMTFRIVDDAGQTVGEGKDLAALRHRLKGRLRAELAATADTIERRGLRTWDLSELPRTFDVRHGNHVARGYPALVDEGESVAVRLLDTEAEQEELMRLGTRRLILLNVAAPTKRVAGRLSNAAKLTLTANPYGSVSALLSDSVAAAVDSLVTDSGGPAWDQAGFARLVEHVRGDLADRTLDVAHRVEAVLTVAHRVESQLKGTTSLVLVGALTDIRAQTAGLVFPGFVSQLGWRRLPDVERYLLGAQRRLEKLPNAPLADGERLQVVQRVQDAYEDLLMSRAAAHRPVGANVHEIRWMIEELRVSLFAQTLRTAYPVSEKRILKAIDAADGS